MNSVLLLIKPRKARGRYSAFCNARKVICAASGYEIGYYPLNDFARFANVTLGMLEKCRVLQIFNASVSNYMRVFAIISALIGCFFVYGCISKIWLIWWDDLNMVADKSCKILVSPSSCSKGSRNEKFMEWAMSVLNWSNLKYMSRGIHEAQVFYFLRNWYGIGNCVIRSLCLITGKWSWSYQKSISEYIGIRYLK